MEKAFGATHWLVTPADTTLSAGLRYKAAPRKPSLGISWLDDGVGTRTELLHRADTCLYEAKRAQRGSAKIFGQNGIVTSGDVKPGTKLRVVA